MYFEFNEAENRTIVTAETDDVCVLCSLFDYCPFIGALESHVVYPSAELLSIEDCPMYCPITDNIDTAY